MRIINVIQSLDGNILNIDSFPVHCENNDETRFYVEEFCCKLVSEHLKDSEILEKELAEEEEVLEFEDYFSADIYDDDLGYRITLINSYIDD